MTVQDLTEEYGMTEAEIHAYAFKNLKSYHKTNEPQTRKLSGPEMRQLDLLLSRENQKEGKKEYMEIDDDWLDPTENEPDDIEVGSPMIDPEQNALPQKEASILQAPQEKIAHEKKTQIALQEREMWETEKSKMQAKIEVISRELATLRSAYLTMQSDAAEKQSQAIHEKQIAEAKITAMREDFASVNHLSNIRIKELEDRNESLENKVKEMHTENGKMAEELTAAKHINEEIKDSANKKGA